MEASSINRVAAANGINLLSNDSSLPPSQTASEFIDSQLQLEADALEALPYAFDHCSNPLGPLRQNLFSCLTCNPPPESPLEPYHPAGICYSCSIACHGEHALVELFARRNFTCDCGTSRMPATSPCTLRIDPATGIKGPVHSQPAATGNTYNKNFQNRFCGCGELHNPHEEKGTMFQCLGLSNEADGGCGEDWWHPECVLGLGRDWLKETKSETKHTVPPPEDDDVEIEESGDPLPLGFPQEDDFEGFICYKCVDANPWIKSYAGSPGFLMPVLRKELPQPLSIGKGPTTSSQPRSEELNREFIVIGQGRAGGPDQLSSSSKSSLDPAILKEDFADRSVGGRIKERLQLGSEPANGEVSEVENVSKQVSSVGISPPNRKRKASELSEQESSNSKRVKDNDPLARHEALCAPPDGSFSVFFQADFRDHLCRCPACYLVLRKYPQLLEEEAVYEPPVSEAGEEGGGESVGTGSLLDRGEAALSNVDRVRAIEGVMAYNHMKDKVKEFLKPFAETGQPVSAEDIKAYFAKLRGDEEASRAGGGVGFDSAADNRREQSGY